METESFKAGVLGIDKIHITMINLCSAYYYLNIEASSGLKQNKTISMSMFLEI